MLAKAKGFDVFVSDFSSIKPKYKEMLKDHNVKVTSIDPDDYAALDGEAILESALEFYEEG